MATLSWSSGHTESVAANQYFPAPVDPARITYESNDRRGSEEPRRSFLFLEAAGSDEPLASFAEHCRPAGLELAD